MMQAQSIQSELQDFVQFASQRVLSGDDCLSLEALVSEWRQGAEYRETIADVGQGIQDEVQGKAQSVAESFAEVRRKLGISD
jgi:hypothetical protein